MKETVVRFWSEYVKLHFVSCEFESNFERYKNRSNDKKAWNEFRTESKMDQKLVDKSCKVFNILI